MLDLTEKTLSVYGKMGLELRTPESQESHGTSTFELQ